MGVPTAPETVLGAAVANRGLTGLRTSLTRRAPPPLRRAAAGLWLDLLGLPARLRDPQARGLPWQTLHNVGGGDYREVGRALLDNLVQHAGLTSEDEVLDIGCGTGRVAEPLSGLLAPRATAYVGFDLSRSAIAACRRQVRRPDFAFVHADIRNADYNPRGAVSETDYVFPCADGSIDLAFATSVFTHLRPDPIRRYLAQTARVLRPGGRFAFTVYGVDAARRRALEAGAAAMPFVPWEADAWAVEPTLPERAVAYAAERIAAWVEEAGLTHTGPQLDGGWCGPATYAGWQDLWVVRR